MSLDTVRHAISRAKKNESVSCQVSLKRKLHDLYAATACYTPLRPLHNLNFAAPPTAAELEFLERNNVDSTDGFRVSTLPAPLPGALAKGRVDPDSKPPSNTVSTSSTAVFEPSKSSPKPNNALDRTKLARSSSPASTKLSPADGDRARSPRKPHVATDHSQDVDSSSEKARASSSSSGALLDAGEQQRIKASRNQSPAIPLASSTKAIKASAREEHGAKGAGKQAGVAVGAANGIEASHGQLPESKDDRGGHHQYGTSHGDLTSSPSSTVGPYSTNTPHNHASPDTSPDDESFPEHMPSSRRRTTNVSKNHSPRPSTDPELPKASAAETLTTDNAPPETADAQLRSEEQQSSLASIQPSESKAPTTKAKPPTPSLPEQILNTQQQVSHPSTPVEPAVKTSLDQTKAVVTLEASLQESQDVCMLDADDRQPPAPSQDPVKSQPHRPSTPSLAMHRPSALPLEDHPVLVSPDALATGRSAPDSARTTGETQRRPHSRRRSQVIFPQQLGESRSDSMQKVCQDYAALKGASQDGKKDYLQTLFEWQAYAMPRTTSLEHMMATANKTLTTAHHAANVLEQHDSRILKRVYQLQNANRWSCRQMERSGEPPRPVSSLDVLLRLAKGMYTDFREERRWKFAAARHLANACAAWVEADPEERVAMQIRTAPVPSSSSVDAPSPHRDAETSQEDDSVLAHNGNVLPPAALFSLSFDDFVFHVDHTQVAENLLSELPQFSANVQGSTGTSPKILPISKFINSKLASRHTGPPAKRRRYDYEGEEELPSYPSKRHALDHSISLSPSRRSTSLDLPAEQTNVALFYPENKHLRDRLHASHAFRPPSEFVMPPTTFFESRSPSMWQWDEDQTLRKLVKDYSFNWSLISSQLHVPSHFTSAAERRTPWECFERWVQLEGLPAEMQKTSYFKTYQIRQEAGLRSAYAQSQQQQQQTQQQSQQPGGAPAISPRRRPPHPVRVERRKNNRYLNLVEAMRKLAKKREQTAYKQQENAKGATLRRNAQEPITVKTSMRTPFEFSQWKHEKEIKLQQKEMIQNQINAQNRTRAILQQSGQAYGQNMGATPPQAQQAQARNGMPKNPNGAHPMPPHQAGQQQQANINMHQRPHSNQVAAMQNGFPHGLVPSSHISAQNFAQANLQQRMQNAPNAETLRLMQQRFAQGGGQAQSQYQNLQHLHANGNGAVNITAAQHQAMLAALGAPKVNGSLNMANGMNGNAAAVAAAAAAAAARAGQVLPQHLSSGHIPAINQIQHQIAQQNPQYTADQIRQLTSERLKTQYSQQRQNAINAATGAAGVNGITQAQIAAYQQQQQQQQQQNGAGPQSTVNYQAQLRQQMMQQQMSSPGMNGGSPGMNGGSPGMHNGSSPGMNGMGNAGGVPSRSNTPQQGQQQQQQQQHAVSSHQRNSSGTSLPGDGSSPAAAAAAGVAQQQSQLTPKA